MLKVVIVTLALVLLLWLLFGARARRGPREEERTRRQGDASSEAMVACAHCGVHLPRSEALDARGLHYCSVAHRDAKR
jgi:uncharacterized protein